VKGQEKSISQLLGKSKEDVKGERGKLFRKNLFFERKTVPQKLNFFNRISLFINKNQLFFSIHFKNIKIYNFDFFSYLPFFLSSLTSPFIQSRNNLSLFDQKLFLQ